MKKMLAMLAMAFAVGAAAEDVLVKEFELFDKIAPGEVFGEVLKAYFYE